MIYFRKKANLSQRQLAIRTGIAQSQLSKLEEGTHWPSKETLSRFCKGLGISANEFFLYMGLQLIRNAFRSAMWLSEE